MDEFPREMGGPREAENQTPGESVDERRKGLAKKNRGTRWPLGRTNTLR